MTNVAYFAELLAPPNYIILRAYCRHTLITHCKITWCHKQKTKSETILKYGLIISVAIDLSAG